MIKLGNTDVYGWEAAIRGMRNPMNSWHKADSVYCEGVVLIGPNDHDLMMRLAKGGPVHAKYRRMITVSVDITDPLYWWKEFDTYKVGTVANSCSTMHKIHAKEFTLDDFSHEHLDRDPNYGLGALLITIDALNYNRALYLHSDKQDKALWWNMIQLLPSSYNQCRTVQLNYEVLVSMYRWRKNHKLDEWRDFCAWIETLPYSELITGGDADG